MSKVLTTNELLKTLKRRAMLPTSQNTFTTSDFIDILNEELEIGIVPFLLSTHEEYLVRTLDVSFSDPNNLTRSVRIPSRAIGNKLRGAAYVRDDSVLFETTRVAIDDLHFFQNEFNYSNQNFKYFVQGDELTIIAEQPATETLRLYFYMRPSQLVEDKYGAKITAINTTTGEITLDSIPDGFIANVSLDFTDHKNPNTLISYDIVASAINSTTKVITVDPANISSKLAVGNFITLAEQTIVPQIPQELHPLLAQRAAVHCVEALGDAQNTQIAQNKLRILETSIINLIDNRVEDSNQKLVNIHGTLRQQSRTYSKRRF